jgi:hypothetical protein
VFTPCSYARSMPGCLLNEHARWSDSEHGVLLLSPEGFTDARPQAISHALSLLKYAYREVRLPAWRLWLLGAKPTSIRSAPRNAA